MDKLYTRFDGVFFEKTRLSLLTLIIQEESVSFNTLKQQLDMSDGALYTHLEKLVSAGYVAKRREIAGTSVQTLYSASEEGKERFREYLDFLEDMITSHKSFTDDSGIKGETP
ncbi:transcriptional regulator [Marispirochaeta aestuarii]|uniref:transcriptional regulator n=1 Tax=Marispirochaeta aestuarii TaxID=1963862 RepID=UPI0029C67A78|nr:transcriptional regulator [Marispirochaeta aestuarii]